MTHESVQIERKQAGQLDWVGGDQRAIDPMFPVERPRARRTDPETSHIAARKVKATGQLTRQQIEVLALVRLHPGSTAVELAKHLHGDDWGKFRYTASRRLPELVPAHVRRGRPRVCKVTGSPQTTWYPIDRSPPTEAA